MNAANPSPARPARPSRRDVVLLRSAVLFALLSAVAAGAVPLTRSFLWRSRAKAVASDLRSFSKAFQAYASEQGDWPAGDGTPGATPPGMERHLAATHWAQPTPIGGRYTWDPDSLHQGSRYRAAVVISFAGTEATVDQRQLQEIDRVLDDGNLASGSFLLGYRNFPVFLLEH